RLRSSHPAVSAFPERVVGSARTSAFSRLARRVTRVAARTLAPSPKCDLLHRRLQPFRHLHDCSGCFRLERVAGWDLHPLESAALSLITPPCGVPRVRSFLIPSCSIGAFSHLSK